MIRKLLFFTIALMSGVTLAATLAEANRLSDNGHYQAAAAAYEALLQDQGPDATLFYNLGNARQRLGELGPAILAYERARLLTPRDPDLRANLARARKTATAFDEPAGRLQPLLARFSRAELSRLATISAFTLGLLALAGGAFRLPSRIRKPALATAILAVLFLTSSLTILRLRQGEAARAIVLTDQAPVRLSPFATADLLGQVPAGSTVLLGQRSGGFTHVLFPDSHLQGWLADADVAPIVPRASRGQS